MIATQQYSQYQQLAARQGTIPLEQKPHLTQLMSRPPLFCHRGGRLQKTVSSALEAGVKRGFLNPDYMRPAWRAELDQVRALPFKCCLWFLLV